MKLTATQTSVLNSAADHPEKQVLQFPDHVKGNARHKVLEGLLARGLIATHDGYHVITEAGLDAIGRKASIFEKDDFESDVTQAESGFTKIETTEGKRQRRNNSKQVQVIDLLKRPEGATIAQICEATGWQAHTVRGTFAGAFKKRLGLNVVSEKSQGGERVYRIVDE